jgi:hypothetical protein
VSGIDELAGQVHATMCSYGTGDCSRWRPGSSHKNFYEEQAQNLFNALEPVIGWANVLPVVQAVLREVGP